MFHVRVGPFRVSLASHIRVACVGHIRVAYVYHIGVVVVALCVVRCGATFGWSGRMGCLPCVLLCHIWVARVVSWHVLPHSGGLWASWRVSPHSRGMGRTERAMCSDPSGHQAGMARHHDE